MKQKKNILVTALAVVAIFATTFIVSCNKSKNVAQTKTNITQKRVSGIPNCNATVENNILIFDDVQSVQAYMDFAATHTNDEIRAIEAQNNFVSYDAKIQTILNGYETLCSSTQDMSTINAYRDLYKQYISISDSDFNDVIQHANGLIINPEGYSQIGNMVSRVVGETIYSTDITNKNLIDNYQANLDNDLIYVSTFSTVKTRNVNQWQGQSPSFHDGSYKTEMSLEFSISGAFYPIFGNQTIQSCYSHFKYRLKNKYRGWTGFWRGDSRTNNFTGNYHASYNPYTNFNDTETSVECIRYYNEKWISKCCFPLTNQGKKDAVNWAKHAWDNEWSYVAGTVTYDCNGTKTFTF